MFAASKSGSADAKDPQFNYVTMLLHGNGTNGAQNNTFTDSSTNNFTITRNGNTTQGTFTPYGSNWSNYFSGTSGQFLNAPANAAFNFGTGDFTIEGFVFPTSTSGTRPIVEIRTTGGANGFALLSQSGATTLNIFTNSGFVGASTNSLTTNQWNHVALTRSGNTWTYWINGVSGGSFTNSSTQSDGATTGPKIGGSSTSGEVWVGYLSNIRIVKGTCLYTSTFTPSTTPFTAISGTSLLTCADNRFLDDSTNNFTITVNGSPSVQRFSPFSPTTAYSTSVIGGSGYFDGSGDYLSVTNPNTNIGSISGDFTFECWINWVTAPPGNSSGNERQIIGQHSWPESSSGNWWTILGVNVGLYAYFAGGGSYDLIASSSFTWNVGAWYHVAVVRSGSTVTIYINGISVGSGTSTKTLCADNVRPLTIGADNDGSHNASNAYISNMRLVKGTAVYTSAFTPPSAPLTAITNTSLLTNFTNPGILDNAMMNDLETVGNAQISTSVKKYGTGSMYFDGAGDYLTSNPATTNLYSYSGDFTIELWLYRNATGQTILVDSRPTGGGGSSAYYVLYVNGSSVVIWNTGNTNRITGTTTISNSTWYHIAVSRSGSSTKLFVNGTQEGSTYTDSTALICATGRPYMGIDANDGTSPLNGYIDDLRITKGVARYTSNFSVPTAAFPDKG